MSSNQILLMFFGLPLAILGVGMRRTIGSRATLYLLLVSTGLAVYAVLVESVLRAAGHGLPIPMRAFGEVPAPAPSVVDLARHLFGFSLVAVLLGVFGGALVRYRGRGSDPEARP